MSHPIQDMFVDEDIDGHKYPRFVENKIVRLLLDQGQFDLNDLAVMEFSPDDREQFAQLIGYSLGGFSELSYVRDKTYKKALRAAHKLMAQIETNEEAKP